MDRPEPGALIAAGQPLCSVFAHSSRPSQVLSMLKAREQRIINQLHKVQ